MIGQAEADLAVAKLPARPEAIRAAENQVKQAEATLEQARWRLSKRALAAPSAGRIDDVIRDPGDIAGPSCAGAVDAAGRGGEAEGLRAGGRFLDDVGRQKLTVRCDGCGDGVTATISYVSPEPEFTPPVIYSLETRQKLVYLDRSAAGWRHAGCSRGRSSMWI